MTDKKKTQVDYKWVSKFNNGEFVRHLTGHEKRMITGVLFDLDAKPQYRCASDTDTKWWFESEFIRVL